MKSHPFSRLLFLLGASAVVLAGCSTDAAEPLIHTPGVGSAFIYDNYATDTTGEKISLSETQSTRTIIGTNATVAGQSGVVQFLESGDTISMRYEANGDVQLLQPATIFPPADFTLPPGLEVPKITVPARWAMFGFGSKAEQTVPGYDTAVFVTVPDIPFPITVTINATGATRYIGNEDLVIAGETIATQKALLTVDVQLSALVISGTVTTTDTLWFAPKLGMVVKDIAATTADLPAQFGGSGPRGGKASIMTAYAMK